MKRISYETAMASLKDSDCITTMRELKGKKVLMPWSRDTVLESLRKYIVVESGRSAKAEGFGIAFKDELGWVFVETRQ